MSRDIFLKFPAIFLPKFVDITYKTKSRVIFIELRLLEYCWQHPDPNLEFLQLQAYSNFGGIYRLPTGRLDGMSLTSSQDKIIVYLANFYKYLSATCNYCISVFTMLELNYILVYEKKYSTYIHNLLLNFLITSIRLAIGYSKVVV